MPIKRKMSVFLIAMLVLTSFPAGCRKAVNNEIVLIKSESYYSDYEVKDNKVYITCYVTLENRLDEEQTVKLSAEFPNDVNKLLKSSWIDSKDNLTLMAKAKDSFNVIFIGDFARTNQKHDRLLPEINIISMNTGTEHSTSP